MSRILILSSFVSYGHVGGTAAGPALQALGHTVTHLPTVVLSNHPGWPYVAGAPVEVAQLDRMWRALDENGFLSEHDCLLVGYLPSAAHVVCACEIIGHLRQHASAIRVVVDPVLGDSDKGLYVLQEVASGIKDHLVPLADLLTPNAFELGWLASQTVDTMACAIEEARKMDADLCLTSPPLDGGQTGVLAVRGAKVTLYQTPEYPEVPKGVGDVFAGLMAAGYDVGAALGRLAALIRNSQRAPHLRIAESVSEWRDAPPISGKHLEGTHGV